MNASHSWTVNKQYNCVEHSCGQWSVLLNNFFLFLIYIIIKNRRAISDRPYELVSVRRGDYQSPVFLFKQFYGIFVTHTFVFLYLACAIKPSGALATHWAPTTTIYLALLRNAFGSYLDYSSKMFLLGTPSPNPCQLF